MRTTKAICILAIICCFFTVSVFTADSYAYASDAGNCSAVQVDANSLDYGDDIRPALEAYYVPGEIIVKFKKQTAETLDAQISEAQTPETLELSASLDSLNRKYGAKKFKPLFRNFNSDRKRNLLQKNKPDLTKTEKRLLRRLNRAPEDVKVPDLGSIYKVELEQGRSARLAVMEYRKDPDVEYAELNYIIHSAFTPNDPYYPVQWALNNTGQPYPVPGGSTGSGTPGADINAPQAWDIFTDDSNVIVAVIDSGVDYTHQDLAGNLWTDSSGHYGYDFFNDDNDPMDDFGHGTHCAGTIAAVIDNSTDVSGMCFNARIMSVKFLNSSGSGPTDDAVSAVYYAVENGADVISNSWGAEYYSDTLEDAFEYAYSQGVINVAAAGNESSSSAFYPAYYDNMISVAATNSDDQKASFSNYGEWVTLAAPGVDILSLRAKDTDMYLISDGYTPADRFIPFGDPNATMYIASGTSMACPHVAAACAFMLSANPLMSSDDAFDILINTVEPIADGICFADGRLNLSEATTAAIQLWSTGRVFFDSDYYGCDDRIEILLLDGDLAGQGTCTVSVYVDDGDFETIILTEESPQMGSFTGTINTVVGASVIEDGNLQVAHDDVIYASYDDDSDGTGNPAVATDTAGIDCMPPLVSNIQYSYRVPAVIVTFDTNELSTAEVFCGSNCGGPYTLQGQDTVLQTSHAIQLSPISPLTTYYFVVEVNDAVGNWAIDSNDGNCYSFTTPGPGDVCVPGQFATIQQAVDYSWPGSTVWIADGTYTGDGNRDIDFYGKSITVKSENGPYNCIIDCQGTSGEPHRGFYFHSGETQSAVIQDLTITNGYGHLFDLWPDEPALDAVHVGGGICCVGSSPTIRNCIVTNCIGSWGGGGIGCYLDSYPRIDGCVLSGNNGGWGGGVACDLSDPLITSCIFINNRNHGALYCSEASPTVKNCLFIANVSTEFGGGCRCSGFAGPPGTSGRPSNPVFRNCTFVGNSAEYYGGGLTLMRNNDVTATDCIFWGNISDRDGHEIFLRDSYIVMTVRYCDIQNDANAIRLGTSAKLIYGPGNIYDDPLFVPGPYGDAYLSQTAAGQGSDSPCVDAGSNTAANHGLDSFTTRSDEVCDSGIVDIGCHFFTLNTPALEVTPLELNFEGNLDRPNPPWQTITVRNTGSEPLHWTATVDANWLSIDVNSGTCNVFGDADTVTVNVNTSGMAEATYYANITVSDPCAFDSPQMVAVELVVIGPVLELSQNEFYFTALMDGANPADQLLAVQNIGGGVLDWQITESCDWLSVYPDSGSTTTEIDDVNIIVDITGLTGGNHICELTVSSDHAQNNPQTVTVELYVNGPIIGLSQNEFYFIAGQNLGNPAPQVLSIQNLGIGTLNWQINDPCGWLYMDPNSGSTTSEVDDVNIIVDISGLNEGYHACELAVSCDDANNSPQNVSVGLYVTAYNLADLTRDWDVDFQDFSIFASQWMQPPGMPSADIDPPQGDGFVGYDDLNTFCMNWLDARVMPNLIAWWRLDGNPDDAAGSNHGSVYGGTWVPGWINGALDFDGSDDYFETSDDTLLQFTMNDSFSISLWTLPVESGCLLSKMKAENYDICFGYSLLWFDSDEALTLLLEGSYWFNMGIYTPNGSAPAGSWNHVVIVYDNRDVSIYINGQHQVDGYFSFDSGDTYPDKNLVLGAKSHRSIIENYFKGSIDDVRIFNKALSQSEIELLYNTGN